MDLMSTIKGSLLENFFPQGWDIEKLDKCCDNPPESVTERQDWWNKKFEPVPCETLSDFDTMMGHEIAIGDLLQGREKFVVFHSNVDAAFRALLDKGSQFSGLVIKLANIPAPMGLKL